MKQKLFISLVLVMVLWRQASDLGKEKPNPLVTSLGEYIRQAKANRPQLQTSEGSLYSEAAVNSELFSDLKARRLNDIVTIRVIENTVAESNADTTTNRKGDTNLAVPNFFGAETHNPTIPFGSLVTANSEQKFTGDGGTKRSGSVTASLSARVVDVLPNGDLVIEGIKEVKVNNERQMLRIFGVVRPRDIGPDNVVLSPLIANMLVQIDGKGILSDNLNPGWLFRILTKVWPF
ncbi:MAG: flagellar basal body L-ring protein FlgH [Terriglobia bacterium]